MNVPPRRRIRRAAQVVGAALALATAVGVGGGQPAAEAQESYQRISGEGSSWSANAIDAMRVNVKQFGITVDYNPSGSTAGRRNFLNGTVDFAASDIPFQFQPEDGSAPENPAPGSYVYIPVTAGGTAFMYNLRINGQRVTNLRLSGENVARIFTGQITKWNDPALQADNPGLTMPDRAIVPVVRSDGSGSTAQFTSWMIDRHPAIWNEYCQRSGRAPACGSTSFFPTVSGMIAQSGDLGVAGYVSQGFAEGAIGYVNYSYALGVQFPVAKVLNAAGFYTEPTPENVAVSLLKAKINTNEANPAVYLTQELGGVYSDTDPRSYQLSSYSYFILPTRLGGQFNEAKGRTLGAFAYYAMCQAQQQSASLGYSPLPINLVEASFEQIRKIPGVVVQDINIQACRNPTFSPDGTNVLAQNAPQPLECDRRGPSQCPNGTGGLQNVPTAVNNPATPAPGGGGGGGGNAPGGGGGGGNAPGGEQPGAPAPGDAPAAPGADPEAPGNQPGDAPAGGDQPAPENQGPSPSGGSPGAGPGASPGGGSGGDGGRPAGGAVADLPEADVGPDVVDGPDVATGDFLADELVEVCDPDTGACGPALGGGGGALSPTANGISPVLTATLPQASGWGAAQTLMVLVGLLVVIAVLAPAMAWRHFGRKEAA